MGKIDGLEEGTSYINENACDESKNDDKKNILEHESPFLLFVNNICSLFHGSIPPVAYFTQPGPSRQVGRMAKHREIFKRKIARLVCAVSAPGARRGPLAHDRCPGVGNCCLPTPAPQRCALRDRLSSIPLHPLPRKPDICDCDHMWQCPARPLLR